MEPKASDTIEATYNFSGAVIFISYVVAVLLLTILLLGNLINAASSLDAGRKRIIPRAHTQTFLQLYSSLALLSFSVLSCHMLSYLILSYSEWATERDIELPYRFWGYKGIVGLTKDRTVDLQIWSWLKTSTLFRDFAQTICETGENFWWAQQALFMTMGWSVFLSIEGELSGI